MGALTGTHIVMNNFNGHTDINNACDVTKKPEKSPQFAVRLQ